MPETMPPSDALRALVAYLEASFRAEPLTLQKVLTAWLAGGHILLNDRPGTGKTTLAKTLARSVDAQFRRIQFTPDLTPSDVLGINLFDQGARAWVFHPGPVFANVVLADEINRAPPRTQAALLEAMGEGQVSTDGVTRVLPASFFVIATQNPLEFEGTFPLPEAQNDRFAMRLSLGYLDETDELDVVLGRFEKPHHHHAMSLADWQALQAAVHQVPTHDDVAAYVVRLLRATRAHPMVRCGASPRGGQALIQACRALAMIRLDKHVTPDHVHDLAKDVLAHRITLNNDAHYSGLKDVDVIDELLQQVSSRKTAR